jgi:hypothetical protein
MTRIHLTAIAIALLSIVAGCGNSGGSAPQPLTKAQFEKRAKALCEKRSNQYYHEGLAVMGEFKEEGKKATPRLELRIFVETVLPGMERKLKAVRALEPPPADAAQVDRILTAIEDVVGQARANPSGFVWRQVHFKRPFHHANELAKGYGLSRCARV